MAFANGDTTRNLNQNRLKLIAISSSVVYSGSMIGLGTTWYGDFSRFHFFNDNDGWGYMDKFGHLATAQQIGRLGIATLRWAGVPENKAIWFGGASGFVFLTSVEIFDGFSQDWGFSMGDALFNAAGSALVISQELVWKEQRILTKWSYHNSPYAKYRPELLGSNGMERWLKDYNGQTYWLSVNPSSFMNKSSGFPKWFNLAVGYGIEGYTGANRNPSENSKGETIPSFRRYSQYYISPDIDFSKIPTDSKLLRGLFNFLNIFKAPLPAVQYNNVDGWRFHWLMF